jgi:hypothetical protein
MGGQGGQAADAYVQFHQAVARLRDEAEAHRHKHKVTARARYGAKAERAQAQQIEGEWIVSKLDALVGLFAPERMGVPPWTHDPQGSRAD